MLSRLTDHRPFASRRLGWKLPVHDEAYPFWQSLFNGFAEPDRDLYASDVTPFVADRMRCGGGGHRAVPAETPVHRRVLRLVAHRVHARVFPDAQFVT